MPVPRDFRPLLAVALLAGAAALASSRRRA
jgi:hypothetical protein